MAHVTFIHGILNKPPKDKLITIWRESLREAGFNLQAQEVTSSLIYWADVLYEKPDEPELTQQSVGTSDPLEDSDDDLAWRDGLAGDQADFVAALADKFDIDAAEPPPADFDDEAIAVPTVAGSDEEAMAQPEAVPLPWFLKRRIMRALLRDVHHYLFNVQHSPREGETFFVQDEIRHRLVEQLKADGAANAEGPHILISHSMGTVIAYDCLKRVADCPKVDGLMTIGSPLGLDDIQTKLKPEWTRDDGFPSEKVGGEWVNVYDKLDPVAGFDPRFANDYKRGGEKVVEDINEQNFGKWRHSITKYLQGEQLTGALRRMLDR